MNFWIFEKKEDRDGKILKVSVFFFSVMPDEGGLENLWHEEMGWCRSNMDNFS